jgi:hypothetical protein
MAKHGFMQYLPEIIGAAALAATGFGVAGIGPLAGAFGAGDAALGAGAAADIATSASAIPAATDVGLASALNAAPATIAGVASDVATPLAAGAPALAADISAPISAAAGDIAGFGGAASAIPAASTLLGGATPVTSAADSPNLMASLSIDNAGGAGSSLGSAPEISPTLGGASPAYDPLSQSSYDPGSIDRTLLAQPAAGPYAVSPSDPYTPGPMATAASPAAAATGASPAVAAANPASKLLTSLQNNPLQLLSLAPLAMAFMQSNSPVPGSGPVTAAAQAASQEAGTLTGQSNQNLSYANTGALPAGVNESINNAANAAKTQVRSSFAGMGIPPGSSMEREQLAAVDANAGAQRVAAANQLTTLGIQEAQAATGQQQIASQQDLALMQAQIQQEKDLEDALAGFSKSLAGPVTSTAGAANTHTTPAVA